MASSSTIHTPTDEDEGQPTNTRLHSLQQQVASFSQSALPQQLDALERYLTMEPIKMSETTGDIIPPAEEVQIRLELAQQLQDIIRTNFNRDDWRFTASHLSALFVMPIDILREIASSGRIGSGCALGCATACIGPSPRM
jgi:hypothetical protein